VPIAQSNEHGKVGERTSHPLQPQVVLQIDPLSVF